MLEELVRRGLTVPSLGPEPEPESFVDYVRRVRPRFRWYRHAEVLAAVLQRVADGELKRVMVFLPPRLGKSEEISRLFTAYFLDRFPDRWVGLGCCSASLANTLSRAARANFVEGGGQLRGDSAAVDHWETKHGGGMWAAGVGGTMIGKGWHLGIIDDPYKDHKEAQSALVRENVREWFQSTFMPREEPDPRTDDPDGALVIVHTRWHEADLSGELLEEAAGDEDPESWHIVRFEAIKEAEVFEVPEGCTLEPDWREPGEPLCPERRPLEKWERIKKAVGAYFWAALFQQRPRPREGNTFKWEWLKDHFVDVAPVEAKRVRYWDTAGSDEDSDGDWTVGVKMALARDGLLYVEDVARGQWTPGRREMEIRSVVEADGETVQHWLERETGIGAAERNRDLLKAFAGYRIKVEPPVGNKELRAEPFANQCEVGNVRIVKGRWNKAYTDELLAFPRGSHDDQVDASSGACNKLVGRRVLKIGFG